MLCSVSVGRSLQEQHCTIQQLQQLSLGVVLGLVATAPNKPLIGQTGVILSPEHTNQTPYTQQHTCAHPTQHRTTAHRINCAFATTGNRRNQTPMFANIPTYTHCLMPLYRRAAPKKFLLRFSPRSLTTSDDACSRFRRIVCIRFARLTLVHCVERFALES